MVVRWRRLNPPGRFLARDGPSDMWNDVGDFAAKKRASKALGERDYKLKETMSDGHVPDLPSSESTEPQGKVAGQLEPATRNVGKTDAQIAQKLQNESASIQDFGNLQAGFSEAAGGSLLVGRAVATSQALPNDSHPASLVAIVSQVQASGQRKGMLLPSQSLLATATQVQSSEQQNQGELLASYSNRRSQSNNGRQKKVGLDSATRPTRSTTSSQQQPALPLHIAMGIVDTDQRSGTNLAQRQQQEQVENQHNIEVDPETLNPNINFDALPTAAALTDDVFTSSDSSREKNSSDSSGEKGSSDSLGEMTSSDSSDDKDKDHSRESDP